MVTESINLKRFSQDFNTTETIPNYNGVTLIGNYNEQKAIITLTSPIISKEIVMSILQNSTNEDCKLSNDVYSCFDIDSIGKFNVRLVYPATDEHIKKHLKPSIKFESETYEEYLRVIEDAKRGRETHCNWIRNIINCSHILDDDEKTRRDGSTENCENNDLNCKRVKKIDEKINSNINEYIINGNNNESNNYESSNSNDTAPNTHKETDSIVKISKTITNQSLITNGNTDIDVSDKSDILAVKEKIRGINKKTNNDASNIKERIYYNDNEFIIIPNYKWNTEDVKKLYLVLLFKEEDLLTIREVTDYNLLVRAKEKAIKTVKKHFGLEANNIYMYFHYHPTYYSLHLHICSVDFINLSADVKRAILIDDVIYNLQNDREYYKKKNMYTLNIGKKYGTKNDITCKSKDSTTK